MPAFKMYPGAVGKVMRSPQVRRGLRSPAQKVLARGEQIAAQEQYELNAHIVEGTRPKGRPYARVQSDDADQEFGTWGKKRRRILGRAAEGG